MVTISPCAAEEGGPEPPPKPLLPPPPPAAPPLLPLAWDEKKISVCHHSISHKNPSPSLLLRFLSPLLPLLSWRPWTPHRRRPPPPGLRRCSRSPPRSSNSRWIPRPLAVHPHLLLLLLRPLLRRRRRIRPRETSLFLI